MGGFGLLKNNFIHVLHNPHTTLHVQRVGPGAAVPAPRPHSLHAGRELEFLSS